MHTTTRRLAFTTLLALVGCDGGKSAPVTVHPVSGQVIVDDKPAEGVKVFLIGTSAPAPPEIPSNPHGVTDASGSFKLSTYGNGDGAAEGGYMVVLLWPEGNGEGDARSADRFLGWYDLRHSKLTYQVNAGDNVMEPFKLATPTGPPPESKGVPGRN